MLIVTINEIPGKKLEALGVVRGSTVQSRNLGHDMMAGFRTLVGGEVTDYADMLTEARQIATGRMVKDAESLGALNTPKGIAYVLDQLTGGAGDIILPTTTPTSEGAGESIKRKVMVDEVYSNRYVDELYDIQAKLKAAEKYYDNSGEKTEDYNDNQRLIFNRASKELSGYWKEIREANNNANLSDKDRKEKIDAIREKANRLAKDTVKQYEKVTE